MEAFRGRRQIASPFVLLFSGQLFKCGHVQGEVQDNLNKEDYIIQLWTTSDDSSISEIIDKV
jgi:hypothetical protein